MRLNTLKLLLCVFCLILLTNSLLAVDPQGDILAADAQVAETYRYLVVVEEVKLDPSSTAPVPTPGPVTSEAAPADSPQDKEIGIIWSDSKKGKRPIYLGQFSRSRGFKRFKVVDATTGEAMYLDFPSSLGIARGDKLLIQGNLFGGMLFVPGGTNGATGD